MNKAAKTAERDFMIIPVILAGGSGTRLWPLSRRLYPKQLLNLTRNHSLLQETILRVAGANGVGSPIVVCNGSYMHIIAGQLSEIGIRPNALVLEPTGRNTAPAVGVAAYMALAGDPEAMILVLPADHMIPDVEQFHQCLEAAACFAQTGSLVTFGIVPQFPETGYGYIRKGEKTTCGGGRADEAFKIRAFVEKPDLERASLYVESGEYCWNSGMFLFRAADILREMDVLCPDISGACRAAVDRAKTDEEAFFLDPESFGACPSDSIDYAVMEKTASGVMVPFEAGWSDVGSWDALYDLGMKDESGNVVRGDVLVQDTKGSLIFSESRMVAAVGMSDAIIVETGDAVLVAARGQSQAVKKIVDRLSDEGRKEAEGHFTTWYGWGSVRMISDNARAVVRQVSVLGGHSAAAFTPAGRVLHWVFVEGEGTLRRGEDTLKAVPDSSVSIDGRSTVILENNLEGPLVFMETYLPDTEEDHF